MLTPDGKNLVWELLKDRVAKVEVTDGGKQSMAVAPTSVVADGRGLVITATFKADQANFDWKVRRVIDNNNKVIDEETYDGGRKVAGAVVDHSITLSWPAAGS